MGGTSGMGTEFRRWNTGTGAWDKISEVKSISGPGMSRTVLDTTTLDTIGGYKTIAAGLRDAGQITIETNFTRSAWEQMKDDFEDDTIQNYEIVLPDTDNTSLEFEGLVISCPLNIPQELMTSTITIQISGAVTVNSGSGPSPG